VSERSRWVRVIAIPCLLGISGIAPALAWDGGNRSGMAGFPSGFGMHMPQASLRSRTVAPRMMARRIGGQNGPRFHHLAQSQNRLPVTLWPYWPSEDTAPLETPQIESEVPSDPYVIVVTSSPGGAPQHTAPEAPPDYSYAGCHAIPIGYHCHIPHNEASP
jgi:hypothetical protein